MHQDCYEFAIASMKQLVQSIASTTFWMIAKSFAVSAHSSHLEYVLIFAYVKTLPYLERF